MAWMALTLTRESRVNAKLQNGSRPGMFCWVQPELSSWMKVFDFQCPASIHDTERHSARNAFCLPKNEKFILNFIWRTRKCKILRGCRRACVIYTAKEALHRCRLPIGHIQYYNTNTEYTIHISSTFKSRDGISFMSQGSCDSYS